MKFDHFNIKVGKLGRMEYIDKDIFTELTYLGFYLEHKVKILYIQIANHFPKFVFYHVLSLFVG